MVKTNKSVYVDAKYGDNSCAKLEDESRPFKSIKKAIRKIKEYDNYCKYQWIMNVNPDEYCYRDKICIDFDLKIVGHYKPKIRFDIVVIGNNCDNIKVEFSDLFIKGNYCDSKIELFENVSFCTNNVDIEEIGIYNLSKCSFNNLIMNINTYKYKNGELDNLFYLKNAKLIINANKFSVKALTRIFYIDSKSSLTANIIKLLIDTNTIVSFNEGKCVMNIENINIKNSKKIGFFIVASDNKNKLHIFNTINPNKIINCVSITGLQVNENILGIDFRPLTQELYGLGSTSTIYKLNYINGIATAINLVPFVPNLSGTSFGFDFNPVSDTIRVVSNTGQNLRINPDTGLVISVDTPLHPGLPNVTGVAYTNSYDGALSTTLYDIDTNSSNLLIQNPPNNGFLNVVGSLDIKVKPIVAFDISINNLGYAAMIPYCYNSSKLFKINLNNGNATLICNIGKCLIITAMSIIPKYIFYNIGYMTININKLCAEFTTENAGFIYLFNNKNNLVIEINNLNIITGTPLSLLINKNGTTTINFEKGIFYTNIIKLISGKVNIQTNSLERVVNTLLPQSNIANIQILSGELSHLFNNIKKSGILSTSTNLYSVLNGNVNINGNVINSTHNGTLFLFTSGNLNVNVENINANGIILEDASNVSTNTLFFKSNNAITTLTPILITGNQINGHTFEGKYFTNGINHPVIQDVSLINGTIVLKNAVLVAKNNANTIVASAMLNVYVYTDSIANVGVNANVIIVPGFAQFIINPLVI